MKITNLHYLERALTDSSVSGARSHNRGLVYKEIDFKVRSDARANVRTEFGSPSVNALVVIEFTVEQR